MTHATGALPEILRKAQGVQLMGGIGYYEEAGTVEREYSPYGLSVEEDPGPLDPTDLPGETGPPATTDSCVPGVTAWNSDLLDCVPISLPTPPPTNGGGGGGGHCPPVTGPAVASDCTTAYIVAFMAVALAALYVSKEQGPKRRGPMSWELKA